MAFVPRRVDAAAEVRLLQDLGHRAWLDDPGLLNFEARSGCWRGNVVEQATDHCGLRPVLVRSGLLLR